MRKPNLLFIFTDEQRYDTMAAYGNQRIRTPNMQRLAESSHVFEQAYVTQTVCTPSRSSLMTGLYPHSTGCTHNNVPLPARVPCIPELLNDPDYATGYHGKWHLGDEIFAQHGFNDWVGIDDGYHRWYRDGRDPEARSHYHHFLIENGVQPANGSRFSRSEALRVPEELSKPAFLAQESSRFIRENRDQPFVLVINFFEPHMPYFSQRDDQYDLKDVELPPNFQDLPTPLQPLKTRAFVESYKRTGHSGLALGSEADWRRMIANYWGLNSLVDTHLGTILDTLESCGLADDTIVVYTSDHGDMMGSHRLLAKCVQFEEAARVPLLLRLPGQTQGRRVTGPISQIDLVPTLLDLMGKAIPAALQGKSCKALLEAPGDQLHLQDDVILEWNGSDTGVSANLDEVAAACGVKRDELNAAIADPIRTLVTADGWKFTCSPRGEHELYDLNKDPRETSNLATDHNQIARMHGFRQRIVAWQQRTGDTVELPPI